MRRQTDPELLLYFVEFISFNSLANASDSARKVLHSKALGIFFDFLAGGSLAESESTQTMDVMLAFVDLPSYQSDLPLSNKCLISHLMSSLSYMLKRNIQHQIIIASQIGH